MYVQFIITHTFKKKKTGRAFHEHILPYFLRETWFQTVLERSISIESLNTEIYYIQFIIFSVNHTHLLQTANTSRARAFSFVYSEVQIGHLSNYISFRVVTSATIFGSSLILSVL